MVGHQYPGMQVVVSNATRMQGSDRNARDRRCAQMSGAKPLAIQEAVHAHECLP